LVGDGQIRGRAVIPDADERHALCSVARQIIGKRTDSLAHLLRRITIEGLLALGSI